MKPRYTKHARQRMVQRGISEAEVEDVLVNHHTTYPDGRGNRIYIGHVNGERVKVVVKGDDDPDLVVIITAAKG